jgi:hypothetical protein
MSFLHKDAVEVVIIYNGPGGGAVLVAASAPRTPPPRPRPPPLAQKKPGIQVIIRYPNFMKCEKIV